MFVFVLVFLLVFVSLSALAFEFAFCVCMRVVGIHTTRRHLSSPSSNVDLRAPALTRRRGWALRSRRQLNARCIARRATLEVGHSRVRIPVSLLSSHRLLPSFERPRVLPSLPHHFAALCTPAD